MTNRCYPARAVITRLVVLLSILSGLSGVSTLAHGQDSSQEPANYAFATYMGAGLFSSTNGSLYVLNVSKIVALEERPDIRIRLSGSTGFFEYETDRIRDLQVPKSIGTLTLIPGIEKVYTVKPDWELIPHLDWGVATNFDNHEEALIYSIGGQSRYYIDAETDRHLWVNKILWAGAKVLNSDRRDNYVKLLTGFDYKTDTYLDVASNRTVVTFYSLLAWSYNGIDYQERLRGRIARDLDVEIGLSLFAPTPIDLGFVDIGRLGLGLQHNTFGNAIRLIFGTPF